MTFFQNLLSTNAPAAVILIRFIVGAVFLSEGIQKFLLPEAMGVGRFTKIGIPNPDIIAPFVGVCEIVCGVLFFLGLLTRFAAVTMTINMLVAIWTTKIPILHSAGFWNMAHEARTDPECLARSRPSASWVRAAALTACSRAAVRVRRVIGSNIVAAENVLACVHA